jgi:hypothetical protein
MKNKIIIRKFEKNEQITEKFIIIKILAKK